MKRILAAATLALTLAGCDAAALSGGGDDDTALDIPEVADGDISAATMMDVTRELSSDEYEGRMPGSKGGEMTVEFLKKRFEEAGLKPGNNGSWTQDVPLIEITASDFAPLTISGGKGEPMAFDYGKDWVGVSYRDTPKTELADSELVFVGYGINAPEKGWNDYEGIDMKGKTAVILVNDADFGAEDLEGPFNGKAMTYYGRWTYKYEEAARLGARGVLLIHNDKRATYGWGVVKNSWSLEGFTIPEEYLGSPFEGWVKESVAEKVFAKAGLDYQKELARAETPDFKPVPLNLQAALQFSPTFRTVKTTNVGAPLPAQTAKPEEAPTVVITAHHDHIGMSKDGEIYSGVVDNTSATSVLLSLARYFSEEEKLPINLLFVAVSAEEQGLWGSRYLAANPPLDKDKIWANINLEMTNIWGPTQDVYAIGADKSELDGVAREAAEKIGLRYIEELDKENGFFFRSDQFSFARAGIPGLWPHEGPTSDNGVLDKRRGYRAGHYHQTSDSLEVQSADWDLQGTLQIADWVIAMVEVLADRSERPDWNEGSAFGR